MIVYDKSARHFKPQQESTMAGSVHVTPSTQVNHYRWGAEGHYDLRVVGELAPAFVEPMKSLQERDPVAHDAELRRRRDEERERQVKQEQRSADVLVARAHLADHVPMTKPPEPISRDYKALLSASWSSELRRQLAAKVEEERTRVACQSAWDDEDLL